MLKQGAAVAAVVAVFLWFVGLCLGSGIQMGITLALSIMHSLGLFPLGW